MKRLPITATVAFLSLSTSGCDFVGDVLEFGFWTIIVLALLVFGLAWGLFRMIQRGARRGPPR